MAKLWDKGYELDRAVERFTVGYDYLLDTNLIPADAAASIAHVRMLASVGLLNHSDLTKIENELRAIAAEGMERRVPIAPSDEDGHTVIEARLTERLGEAGKRVHTGRSRNDQVTAATRLYTREALLEIGFSLTGLVNGLLARAEEQRATIMPGRTHLQIAMPSTLGMWFASWAEQLLDDAAFLSTAAELNDRSPLGSAAGYGTPLPLNREMVAELLGFRSIQNNVLAVQHSRGALDARICDALSAVSATLSRLAQDAILFSLPELGYLRLPDELCSGSSIMPQKRNPDVLELLRSRSAVIDGWALQCRSIVRGLPSGYNRDQQDTKEPLIRSLRGSLDALEVTRLFVERVEADRARMRESLTAEVFATDYAFDLVSEGVPFRDAYRRAAAEYGARPLPDAEAVLARRSSTGSPGHLNLAEPRARLAELERGLAERASRHTAALRGLLGEVGSIIPSRGVF